MNSVAIDVCKTCCADVFCAETYSGICENLVRKEETDSSMDWVRSTFGTDSAFPRDLNKVDLCSCANTSNLRPLLHGNASFHFV